MLQQQKNSTAPGAGYDLTGSCFPLASFQRASTAPFCPPPTHPLFVLLPDTKLPVLLPSRQLGFEPASQVAAGTQMKEPLPGCLWHSAQPDPAALGPSCPTKHPAFPTPPHPTNPSVSPVEGKPLLTIRNTFPSPCSSWEISESLENTSRA